MFVCVCNLCLAARVCVSILIYICLTAWHMCLLREDAVPVFVCKMRHRGVGSEGNTALRCPHRPLVMRMPLPATVAMVTAGKGVHTLLVESAHVL